jgi:nicotinate-nucleotide pyrophosphorylase (carboxylating)
VLTDAAIETIVFAALEEDAPWGDITSELFVPPTAVATAEFNAREPGVFSGGAVLVATFAAVDPSISVELQIDDGERFATGDVLAVISGNARGVLRAERIALNLVQRMSGIATLTAQYVALAGAARIVDTRKTTPGLRAIERHGGPPCEDE